MNKLSKLILDLKDSHLSAEMVRTLHDYEFLRAHLPQIFPSKEIVEELMTMFKPVKDKNSDKVYSTINLPGHTRDNDWMAEYISRSLELSPSFFNEPKIKYSNIKSFIKIDPEYLQARYDYEQNMVRAEIINIMTERLDTKLSGYSVMRQRIDNTKDADEAFRDAVIVDMGNLGLDQHTVEVGLEKNGQLWRNQAIETTFINKYLRPLSLNKDRIDPRQYIKIVDKVINSRHVWFAVREHDYYCKHKNIIDEVGIKTKNMQIEPHDALYMEMTWRQNYKAVTEPIFGNENTPLNESPCDLTYLSASSTPIYDKDSTVEK